MTLISSVQMQQRQSFERNVSWALSAGALAGLSAAAVSGSRLGGFFLWAVASGTLFCFAAGERFDRWVMRALAVVLPGMALLLPGVTGDVACGAVAGGLLVASSVAGRGTEGRLGMLRPGAQAYVMGAVAGAVLLVVGARAANILSLSFRNAGMNWVLATIAAGVVAALFLAFAALPAHVMVEADPVEAKAQALQFELSAELGALCDRMLGAYRRCGELLRQLPRDHARAELASVTERAVSDALDLAREWQQVEVQLEASSEADLNAQLKSLRTDAAAATDALARRQLLHAADSLAEEVQRLDGLSARRERVMARLKATGAELDRTRLSLLSLRSARTQTKATELSALSRKLKSLASLESTRGALESAVATSAELAHAEVADADAAAMASVRVKA